MPKYEISFTLTEKGFVNIEADSEEEAKEKLFDAYCNGNAVFNTEDISDVSIKEILSEDTYSIIKLEEKGNTSLLENGFWQKYSIIDNNNNKIFTGWKLIEHDENSISDKTIKEICLKHISKRGGLELFPKFADLRDYTCELIMNCHTSDNEMWFVEHDNEDTGYVNLNEISENIEKWNLAIELNFVFKDDPMITVYGGISEQVNFIDSEGFMSEGWLNFRRKTL